MGKYFLLASLLLVVRVELFCQQQRLDVATRESSMTYTLIHPLHTIDATSKEVNYAIDLDTAKKEIRSVMARVDVTSFDSGNSNRDSHAMEVIDAITYPDASFSSTSITQKGDSLTVIGKVTFHGVTNEMTSTGTSRWSSDTLEVRGKFDLSLTAFKIDRPSLLMIPVQDTLRFAWRATFTWK